MACSDDDVEETHEDTVRETIQHPKLSMGLRRVDSLELHRLRVPLRERRPSRSRLAEPSSPPTSWKLMSYLGLSPSISMVKA